MKRVKVHGFAAEWLKIHEVVEDQEFRHGRFPPELCMPGNNSKKRKRKLKKIAV